MSSGKRLHTNTVMDSKCQEFNISILFLCFYELDFYYICHGQCVCVVKGIAENVYRGKRLRVRIVREIWDEEEWDKARGVSTNNT